MGTSNSMLVRKGTLDHPRFKKVRVVQSQGQTYLETYATLSNQIDAKRFKTSLKSLQKFSHQLILVPIQTRQQQQVYCGNMILLKLIYPYYPFSLELEIKDRRLTRTHFKINEIWYLLDSLVKAGKQFQKQRMLMEDVRPYNILLNSQGEIKIITRYSIPFEWEDIYDRSNHFVSPEEMKDSTNKQNMYLKSDIFSCAITVLEALTLKNMKQFYNHDLGVIDLRYIQIMINKLKLQWPPLLLYILQKMIIEDPKKRPYFHQINSLLSPYSPHIQQSQSFVPDIQSSYSNLSLFHSCYKSFKSSAFSNMLQQLESAKDIPNRSISSHKYKSERLHTPSKTPSKPFISAIEKTPTQIKSRTNIHRPLYQQNYYKLKQLEEKRSNSQLKKKV